MKKVIQEFKEFAVKGNAIDLAFGVIIGGAFGKIVTSIVQDLFMPLIGILTGGINFAQLNWTVSVADREPVMLAYGKFLQNIIDFLIIAVVIFIFVRFLNQFKKKEEKKEAAKPSANVVLLTEIRDLLKKQSAASKRK